MKKTACALLVIVLFMQLLSCAETKTTSEVTDTEAPAAESTETVTEDTAPKDNLPSDLKFNGETVSFYGNSSDAKYSPNLVTQLEGEVLNDARNNMEIAVEERLNVSLEEVIGADNVEGFNNEMRALVLAEDTTYDIMSNMDRYMIPATIDNYFIPTSDLKYVDLSAYYWNSDATGRFSIGGKIYYPVTSFNLFSYKNTNCVLVNLDIANDLSIPSLYNTVNDGKWTYDLLDEYASGAYKDVNGNSKCDTSDMYGLASFSSCNMWLNAVVGWGCCDEIMRKDGNDYFVYGYSEKYIDVLDYIFNLLQKNDYATETNMDFSQNNVLFFEDRLGGMDVYRDTDFDYTALPTPKKDEQQEKYYCRTYDTYFTMVLNSCDKPDICGAVLEALSSEAYTNVLPAYIDITLQSKYSMDSDAAQMIQTIIDSRTISLAEAYMYSLYGNDQKLYNSMHDTLSAVSSLQKIQKLTERQISDYNKVFEAIR